jgi:hypothetical protein
MPNALLGDAASSSEPIQAKTDVKPASAGVMVSIVVSIEPGKVRHFETLSRQIARAVNELALLCRTAIAAWGPSIATWRRTERDKAPPQRAKWFVSTSPTRPCRSSKPRPLRPGRTGELLPQLVPKASLRHITPSPERP